MMRTKHVFLVFLCLFLSFCFLSYGDDGPVTGILGAFSEEMEYLDNNVGDRHVQTIEGIPFVTGKLGGRQVVLALTGIGKVNAAMTTTLLLEHFRPEEVLFTGIAGGINPDLLPGDIVIAEKTSQHDLGILTPDGLLNRGMRNPLTGIRNPVFFPADSVLLGLAETSGKRIKPDSIKAGAAARIPKIITGIVVTGDVFVASPSKKIELREKLSADAVEMEGAAVAQICWQHTVPCLVIRSLSDSANEQAEVDIGMYRGIAARNAALLVEDIVKQLAALQSPQR